jgi:hypothetical protein
MLAFAAVTLLQTLLMDNLNLGLYITPLVYPAFLAALSSRIRPWQILTVGLLLGMTVDLFSGGAGLNTIASLATAFCRQGTLRLFVGREAVREGVAPLPAVIGSGKAFRYVAALTTLHCAVYVCFETLATSYLHLTLLRIILSSAISTILIFLILRLLGRR